MYFPYLYGRRAELLALRDVAPHLTRWKTTPVIEPANLDPGDLVRCLQGLDAEGASCCLIVNPSQGQFTAGGLAPWLAKIRGFVANPAVVRPTFQVFGAGDRPALQVFLRNHHGRDVAVVVRTADLPPAALATDLAGSSAIVFLHARSNPGAYARALPRGAAVEVAPRFNVQARNADYNGPEWLTSSHQTYLADGLPGFSDFGPLPPTFSLRGGQAAAVAIHLTYEEGDGSIWVQHFVSDSTEIGDGDVTSKMAEATKKVFDAVRADPTKFVVSPGVQAYIDQHATRRPTNLTMNKRQQISHHLATVGPLV